MSVQWSLHEAKNRFSAVVEAARRGEPQTVTKRGVAAVVVVSAEEYRRLKHLETMQAPTFKEHLLAIPTNGTPSDDEGFERMGVSLRDVEL
jgi:prevent-host-death family protein